MCDGNDSPSTQIFSSPSPYHDLSGLKMQSVSPTYTPLPVAEMKFQSLYGLVLMPACRCQLARKCIDRASHAHGVVVASSCARTFSVPRFSKTMRAARAYG